MSKQAFIFEVSDRSFDKYVIGNSDKVPVFVAFISVWSEPCIQMSDMFAGLAKEFAEEFVFAKVDVEENGQLKEQYGIENVPTLKVFVDGQVVAIEEGLLSEQEARALLKNFAIVNKAEEQRLQARQLHMQGETQEAVMLLTLAIQQDPSNTRVAMDMVQIFIDMGEIEQASSLFNRLPEKDKASETGLSLSGQLWIIEEAAKTAGLEALNEVIATNPDDYDARFDCAICEIAAHNYQQALDHLFHIQQNNADYKEGAAREMIITIINTIAPNNPEMAQQYRTQLAGMLAV
ncbi:MAG: tetratricopeptide repeat protein [Gammaproteobacteria bacterium]|nr:tetratricopeptide repeat protein [Gammaproteobacteria bacterium]NNJ50211.1 tetratricopeptide repeat protein [Gammaproteobacteria bacterium]